jgi:hypothetical protein
MRPLFPRRMAAYKYLALVSQTEILFHTILPTSSPTRRKRTTSLQRVRLNLLGMLPLLIENRKMHILYTFWGNCRHILATLIEKGQGSLEKKDVHVINLVCLDCIPVSPPRLAAVTDTCADSK